MFPGVDKDVADAVGWNKTVDCGRGGPGAIDGSLLVPGAKDGSLLVIWAEPGAEDLDLVPRVPRFLDLLRPLSKVLLTII